MIGHQTIRTIGTFSGTEIVAAGAVAAVCIRCFTQGQLATDTQTVVKLISRLTFCACPRAVARCAFRRARHLAFSAAQRVTRIARRAGRGRRTRFAVVGAGDFLLFAFAVSRQGIAGLALDAFGAQERAVARRAVRNRGRTRVAVAFDSQVIAFFAFLATVGATARTPRRAISGTVRHAFFQQSVPDLSLTGTIRRIEFATAAIAVGDGFVVRFGAENARADRNAGTVFHTLSGRTGQRFATTGFFVNDAGFVIVGAGNAVAGVAAADVGMVVVSQTGFVPRAGNAQTRIDAFRIAARLVRGAIAVRRTFGFVDAETTDAFFAAAAIGVGRTVGVFLVLRKRRPAADFIGFAAPQFDRLGVRRRGHRQQYG